MLHHKGDVKLRKVVRETQAEAVAFVVSRGIGLETGSAAADYIALYNGDSKMLAASLAEIQQTASTILKDLLPEERRPESMRSPGGDAVGDRGREHDPSPGRDGADGVALER